LKEECAALNGRYSWPYNIWYIWKQLYGHHLPSEANYFVDADMAF